MRKMRKNEVRCFKISGNAINELLWELLNINGDMLLDIPEKTDVIFHMNWDKEKDELIFSALEFAQPHPVDFKAIDFYINEHIGITTESVFSSSDNLPYKSFLVPKKK